MLTPSTMYEPTPFHRINITKNIMTAKFFFQTNAAAGVDSEIFSMCTLGIVIQHKFRILEKWMTESSGHSNVSIFLTQSMVWNAYSGMLVLEYWYQNQYALNNSTTWKTTTWKNMLMPNKIKHRQGHWHIIEKVLQQHIISLYTFIPYIYI